VRRPRVAVRGGHLDSVRCPRYLHEHMFDRVPTAGGPRWT
jgi:hypothetical protein